MCYYWLKYFTWKNLKGISSCANTAAQSSWVVLAQIWILMFLGATFFLLQRNRNSELAVIQCYIPFNRIYLKTISCDTTLWKFCALLCELSTAFVGWHCCMDACLLRTVKIVYIVPYQNIACTFSKRSHKLFSATCVPSCIVVLIFLTPCPWNKQTMTQWD